MRYMILIFLRERQAVDSSVKPVVRRLSDFVSSSKKAASESEISEPSQLSANQTRRIRRSGSLHREHPETFENINSQLNSCCQSCIEKRKSCANKTEWWGEGPARLLEY